MAKKLWPTPIKGLKKIDPPKTPIKKIVILTNGKTENVYKLRTTNESCKKPTQILSVSLNSYTFNRDLLYTGTFII